MTFPEFMFRNQNKIPSSQQNTPDIEGYYYTANDGSQMAFWTYKADRVSKEHKHDYDEWMLCVEGEYIVTIDGAEHTLRAGDELFIPKGSLQGGRVKAGTRSIHAFGGKRISEEKKMNITFGQAEKADISQLIRLRYAYMEDDFGSVSEREKSCLEKQLPDYFERKLGKELFAFVARDGEKIVSVALLLTIEMPANPNVLSGFYGEVLNVFTQSEYRGKGLASTLMKNLIEFAKEKGLSRIDLSATDAGFGIYEKLGFKEKENRYRDMRLKF